MSAITVLIISLIGIRLGYFLYATLLIEPSFNRMAVKPHPPRCAWTGSILRLPTARCCLTINSNPWRL